MTDSPLDETAFAALVRDATDEDLPALACARGADDAPADGIGARARRGGSFLLC